MTTAPINPWFHRPRPNPAARARLFAFPYAGGAATVFHTWPAGLPADVELVALALPGRSFRLRERSFTRMAPLVDELDRQLAPFLDRPFAFFGHSMGAAIAHELTQRLRDRGRALPERLFVSARRAPHIPAPGDPLHTLPDREFMIALRDHYNTPAEVLQNRELQELVLPALRADLELLETWTSVARPPLPVAIAAFAGAADRGVPLADVEAWRQHTAAGFTLDVLPGDHLFLHSAQPQLLARLSSSWGARAG